jgi:hypothetical protein
LGWTVGILIMMSLLAPEVAAADDSKLSEAQRQQIIHVFLAERPFVHRALPRGKAGIRIEGDKVTPTEAESNRLIVQYGVVAKAGEHVNITAVRFVHRGIVFELNGGPEKHKRLRDHINVGVNGVDPSQANHPQATEDGNVPSSGSTVLLEFKDEVVKSLTTDQIKELLAPVLDFKAMSVAEAYQKSLPPVLAAAVKIHKALVGMDKDTVTYALGRPPRRIRETKEGQEIEEWIYGTPPQDVEFIRFIGDKAVSIEDMKITGEKVVRTENEVGDLGGTLDAAAQTHKRPDSVATSAEEERSAPTLLRPDEKPVKPHEGARDPNPTPAPYVGTTLGSGSS